MSKQIKIKDLVTEGRQLQESFKQKMMLEFTITNFGAQLKGKKLDMGWLKQFMPATAKTVAAATKKIKEKQGGRVFEDISQWSVTPKGNKKDKPMFSLGVSQYNSNTIYNPEEKLNVSELRVSEIKPNGEKNSIGSTYVFTDVFLKEVGVVFDAEKTFN